MKFVKNESEDDLVWQRHPFAWWHEVLSHTTDTERLTQLADTSCIKNTGICYNIQQTLQDIDQQMDILKSNTDMWGIACLKQLRKNSEQLTNLTTEAEEESDFTAEIDKENFCDLLKESQTAVTTGKAAVEHKLADLKKMEQNCITLVSVVGTLGGLMILAILATLCFSVSKRHSGIKKTPVSRDNRKK
ncbi:uncharacterized protein LOC121877101 [Homarus americanus]|uniref:uncharacterized protein LOC121872502 n=1 Tax=Homarus americanus TaxID=6706 RepID=UPI001C437427|nr:uncharacterized protein LOC121872502 [Homarus americanus]XP_042238670.1 uncharacterized protein LOC121877101 [Homarus americanus]